MRAVTFEVLKLLTGDAGKIQNLKSQIKNGLIPEKGEEIIMSGCPDVFNYGDQIIRELVHDRAGG